MDILGGMHLDSTEQHDRERRTACQAIGIILIEVPYPRPFIPFHFPFTLLLSLGSLSPSFYATSLLFFDRCLQILVE